MPIIATSPQNSQPVATMGASLMIESGGFKFELSANGLLTASGLDGNPLNLEGSLAAQQQVLPGLMEAIGRTLEHQESTLATARDGVRAMSARLNDVSASFANDNRVTYNVNDVDANGWVLVTPQSATTGTRLWALPANLGRFTWNEGTEFVRNLRDFHGYNGSQTEQSLKGDPARDDGGARRFTQEEGAEDIEPYLKKYSERRQQLVEIYGADAWLQTASPRYGDDAWFQRLSDGTQHDTRYNYVDPVLLVRSEPRPAQP